MSINLRLPWPPSVNSYLQPRKDGKGKYLSDRGRKFRGDVLAACYGHPRQSGRLAVQLELSPPDRRQRDIDNHIKATLDALEHAGLFENDEQIDELVVKRLTVDPPGCCDVVITKL